MSSNYTLASQCQLRRDEIHELLILSVAAASTADYNNNNNNNHHNDNDKTDSGAKENDKLSLWRTLLTDAHVRTLMLHTLVRVSIPKNKQQLLIHENKYAKAAAAQASSAAAAAEGSHRYNYRVGKVVTLMPRARASSNAPQAVSDASSTGSLLSEWLLGVNFGEVTEVLGAKYVSNEPFTEAEHGVFVRSCLSAQTSAATPALMAAAEADVVIRNLHDIRRYVTSIVAERGGKAAVGGTASLTSTARGGGSAASIGGSRRRPRDSSAGGDESMIDGMRGSDDNDDDTEAGVTLNQLLAERAAHREERRRWELLCSEQQQHLSGLRQLLNGKNGEIQRALHARRRAEAEHRTEMEQWRVKTEEQGQAIRQTERLLVEEREVHREHKEKTEKLVAQMKKLAEQTRKFKEVSDAVSEWMHLPNRQPEEVLASLKRKISESST